MNEVIGRLSGDEEATPISPGWSLVGIVQELHHLELGEGDAELEEGVGEAGRRMRWTRRSASMSAPSGG